MKVVGFALSFLGSSVQSLGLVLQKKAQNKELSNDQSRLGSHTALHNEEDDEVEEDNNGGGESSTVSYLKSKLWICGFTLHTIGSILSFVSIGLIGPALFVVISTFGLVSNLIFSSKILHESSYPKDYAAIAVIAVGISLCIVAKETAGHREPLTVDDVHFYITRPIATIIWGCLAGLLGGLTYACRLKKNTVQPHNTFQRTAFIIRSAISATLQVLLSTPTSVLVQNVRGAAAVLWVVAVAMICNIFLDVHFQNRSLKFNDLLTHGPIAFVVWQVTSLLTSATIYDETKGFERMQWILSGSGVFCTIFGVGITATRPQPGSEGYMVIAYL